MLKLCFDRFLCKWTYQKLYTVNWGGNETLFAQASVKTVFVMEVSIKWPRPSHIHKSVHVLIKWFASEDISFPGKHPEPVSDYSAQDSEGEAPL